MFGILELTPTLLTPQLSKTASAVVVPPGMLSPIIKQSVELANFLPICLPEANACRTADSSSPGSKAIFLPGTRPVSIYGSFGAILLPALITTCGMSADSKAALVRSAGVGFPSGVIGITSILLQNP